jgi:hypothetical protein
MICALKSFKVVYIISSWNYTRNSWVDNVFVLFNWFILVYSLGTIIIFEATQWGQIKRHIDNENSEFKPGKVLGENWNYFWLCFGIAYFWWLYNLLKGLSLFQKSTDGFRFIDLYLEFFRLFCNFFYRCFNFLIFLHYIFTFV